MEPSVVIANY